MNRNILYYAFCFQKKAMSIFGKVFFAASEKPNIFCESFMGSGKLAHLPFLLIKKLALPSHALPPHIRFALSSKKIIK